MLATATPALALARSAATGFTATDNRWSLDGSGAGTVNVPVGATVSFAYPQGTEDHNAMFSRTGVSCTVLEGDDPGPSGQSVPEEPETAAWSGECTFTREGRYDFVCVSHLEMTGTVIVGNPATATPTATPAATATATPAATTAPTTTTTPGATQTPSTTTPQTAARKLTVAASQKGSAVRGTIVGVSGKVTVELQLKSKRVGKTTRTGAGAFTVKLDKSFKRRGKLRLTLKVTAAGRTDTKTVTLRR